MGEEARTNSRGRNRAAEDRMGAAMAGRAKVSRPGCAGEDALSGVLCGSGEDADRPQSERIGMRHAEHRLWSFGGFCGASRFAGRWLVSFGEFGGYERFARGGRVLDCGAL